jgi:flagellin-like hook-associated protein FlgL
VSRIVDLASANQLMSYVQRTQQRLNTLQTQLSSGKTSQDYTGIARDSGRLIRSENARDLYQRFMTTNQTTDLRLKTVETTLGSVQTTVKDFRAAVLEFDRGATGDPERVAAVQDAAFKSLVSLQGLLNTESDGRYLLAGSKATTRPVDFGLTTLDAFQKTFDGAAVTVPTTREAHLAGVTLTHAVTGDLTFDRASGTITFANPAALAAIPDGATITFAETANNDGISFTVIGRKSADPTDLNAPIDRLVVQQEKLASTGIVDDTANFALTTPEGGRLDHALTGNLTFDAVAGTIEASIPGSLAAIPVGSAFTVTGTANDGTYTVKENNGNVITIAMHSLTDEAPAPETSELRIGSYYRGDTVTQTHRVDSERSVSLDLTAADPAFEKAIRAMKLIAQGRFGSEGGLDQNTDRIEQALALLDSALDRASPDVGPNGPEAASNLETIQREVGLHRALINDTNARLRGLIGALDNQVADVETVNPTEVATRLFDQANALEASLTTIARVRQLSLVKFL